MSWGAVIAAAGAVVGGAMNNRAAKKGASSQQSAEMAAIEEQRRQYDQTREDMQPWMQSGRQALDMQGRVLAGDYSGFNDSPDYLYARDSSLQALDRSAAARGGYMGGGADADRIELANGLATQNLNNYWNKLAGMSGAGQQTAANLGTFGQNSANSIGNSYGNIGAARASSYAAQANNWGNVMGQLGNIWGQYQGQQPATGSNGTTQWGAFGPGGTGWRGV